jgi:hypothetical protein
MDKDKAAAITFLVVAFLGSFVSHLLYVKGYAFAIGAKHLEIQGKLLTGPFSDQIECEHVSHTHCEFRVCGVPIEKSQNEPECHDDDKKGWFPVKEH